MLLAIPCAASKTSTMTRRMPSLALEGRIQQCISARNRLEDDVDGPAASGTQQLNYVRNIDCAARAVQATGKDCGTGGKDG